MSMESYIYTRVPLSPIYRVFTGNCGKVMGNNTAAYQVIQLLLYYLCCLMLDISGTNTTHTAEESGNG